MQPTRAVRVLALLVTGALLLGACSDDHGGKGGVVDDGHATTVTTFLTTLADQVIIPSYRALVTNLDALDARLASLCTTPSAGALDAATAAWRDSELAWESTRPSDVGPAIDRRLMSAVGFRARAADIEALLAGTTSVAPTTLAAAGAGVRGIFAVEVALFGAGAPALATPAGGRRCTYARSATRLARTAAQQVLDDWTGPKPYRARFIAGMDGDPQTSVEAVVNELTFRLQEADDQGLRSLVEAASYDALPDSRKEGPGAYGLASLRAILDGVVAAVRGPDGEPGLAALVSGRSRSTGDRLDRLAGEAADAMRGLPDSLAAGLEHHDALVTADRAVAALRVLVSTTVASQLGVTIGFSDADGDS